MERSPIEIFFSYSREDKPLRDKLEIHLSSLRQQGVISSWHDRQIVAGSEWEEEIDRHMRTADIILLLVSPDFVNSKYCYDIELPYAIARHDAGEAYVIPILLRPVAGWKRLPFAKLQVYPSGAVPITQWADQDTAFVDVVEGIETAVEKLLTQRQEQIKAEEQWRKQHAGESESFFNSGWEKGNKGDNQAAIADYDQAIRRNPDYAAAYSNRGNARSDLGDNKGAIADYDQAIKLKPDYANAYNYRGNARTALGDKPGAIADYDQAIKLNPDYAAAYYNRGIARKSLGNKSEAIADFQKAADLYQKQGKPDDYQDALNRLKALQP